MGKRKVRTSEKTNRNGGGLNLSYAALGTIVAILTIGGIIWKVGSAVATKSDIDSIRALITPVLDKHEDRIRTLELQMARYFGASQTALKPSRTDQELLPLMTLAQYAPQSIPDASANTIRSEARRQLEQPRRVVVPDLLILEYGLQPSRGGTYSLLGEDGRYYALDDVLAVIIKMHLEERNIRRPLLKK